MAGREHVEGVRIREGEALPAHVTPEEGPGRGSATVPCESTMRRRWIFMPPILYTSELRVNPLPHRRGRFPQIPRELQIPTDR